MISACKSSPSSAPANAAAARRRTDGSCSRFGRLQRTAALICVVSGASCSGEIGQVEPGVLSLQLQPSAAVRLTLLEYTLSHESGFVRTGPVAVGESRAFSFRVDTLPPATGYEITAYAEGTIVGVRDVDDVAAVDDVDDVQAHTVCTGRATFDIKTAQSTAVSMRLQCEGLVSEGTEHGGTTNVCPTVGVISAAPAEAPVGQQVNVSAQVPDDPDGPFPLVFAWSAESGLIGSASSATTRFVCDRAGVVAVKLSVSDGDEACTDPPAAVYVTCTDAECVDLTHCPDSPAVTTANDGAPTTAIGTQDGRGTGQAGSGGAVTQPAAASLGAGGRTSAAGGAGAGSGTGGVGGSRPQLGTGGRWSIGWPPSASTPNTGDSSAATDTSAAGSGGSSDEPTAGSTAPSEVADASSDTEAAPSPADAGVSAPPWVPSEHDGGSGTSEPPEPESVEPGVSEPVAGSGGAGAGSGAIEVEPTTDGGGGASSDTDMNSDEARRHAERDRQERSRRQPTAGHAGSEPDVAGASGTTAGVGGADTDAGEGMNAAP